MSRAETLPVDHRDTGVGQVPEAAPVQHLRESVTVAVRHYLQQLDGQMSTDVYQMVLAEIEEPLLREIMAYTRNNQTRASVMLGLNRGTLRKKLKQYNLISDKSQ